MLKRKMAAVPAIGCTRAKSSSTAESARETAAVLRKPKRSARYPPAALPAASASTSTAAQCPSPFQGNVRPMPTQERRITTPNRASSGSPTVRKGGSSGEVSATGRGVFVRSRAAAARSSKITAIQAGKAPPLPRTVPQNSPTAPGETNSPSGPAFFRETDRVSSPAPTWNAALPRPAASAASQGKAVSA